MTVEDALALAHRMYAELSIESQVITADNTNFDDRILVGARVITPEGTYTAWAEGSRRNVTEIEEQAVLRALLRTKSNFIQASALFADQSYDSQVVEDDEPEAGSPKDVDARKQAVATFFKGNAGEKDEVEQAESDISCADCRGPVAPYYGGTITLSAREVAERTLARHGRILCADCSSAAVIRKGKKVAD